MNSIGRLLSGGVQQLFRPTPSDKTAPANGDFGFYQKNVASVNASESLRLLGNRVGSAQTAAAQKVEWHDGPTLNGDYIAAVSVYDLGQTQWSNKVDPAAVSQIGFARALIQANITKDPNAARQVAERLGGGMVLELPNGKQRAVTSADFGDRDFMKIVTDGEGRFLLDVPKSQLDEARKLVKQLESGGEAALNATNQADAGVAVLGGSLAAGKIAQTATKVNWSAINLRAAATGIGGAIVEAAPLAPVAIGLAGQGALVRQRYLYEKQKWEAQQKGRVLPLPAVPPTVLQNTAKKPETKVADRPQAKGQPIPDANTQAGQELAVRPKAAPTTTTKPMTNAPQATPPQSEPPKLPKVPKSVPEAIAGVGAAAIGKAAADVAKRDVAPNGVVKIHKREWSQAEYKQWFDALPRIRTPQNTPANLYEIKQTEEFNYSISGNGEKLNADGIAGKDVLEAKFVTNPERSLFIKDSKLPNFLRKGMEEKGIRSELSRLDKILRDDSNPLTSVRIITNNKKAASYLLELMKEYNVPGEVVVKQ